MQTVLSIDVSLNPIVGSVAEVSGRQVRVVEQHTADMGDLFKPVYEGQSETPEEAQEESSEEFEGEDSPDKGAENSFRKFLSLFKTHWTDATLIIPAHEFVSLTLELPFGDSKSIERILDMEVQDLVPFDTEDFVIQHSTLGPSKDGGFDVHVDLMPVDYIQQVMAVCKNADFEPRVLSSTTGILSSVYFLAPEYLTPNSAIFTSHGGQYHFVLAQDSDVRVVRVMSPALHNPQMNGSQPENGSSSQNLLFAQLKLTIAAAEKKFGNRIENIYLIGDEPRPSDLQAACGRPVEKLELGELIKGEKVGNDLAALSSVFVQDVDPPVLLTNFRTRQFAYSPQLKELVYGLRQLTPFLVGLALALLVSLIGVYFIRDYRIASIRSAMVEEVRKVIPDLELETGNEMKGIQVQLGQLGKQLQAIGSSSSLSPLDAFYVLSEGIPDGSGADFKKLEIRGEQITLQGSAPNYTAFEKLTAALKKRPEFSKVDDTNPRRSSGGQISFNYTISLSVE